MKRVIAYVDGFNLYFGLRAKGWKRFYWLNIQQVARHLLRPGQTLVATKYFTAKVKYPPDKQRRQNTFLEALGTLPDFHIYYGHYLADKIVCRKCGYTYTTHHEKMTDVNIAMELLSDAFQNSFDMALLISADSDLVGPIKKVKRLFPKKRVIVVFPPKRHSNALKNVADVCLHLDRATLAKSVFPDEVVKADGFVLRRPSRWR
ncbi:MAG: NYN domain-containing protein [Chloroflexota bacterium]|nr:NYN domain-containing protein [Chloroflexota bacterium]